MLNKNSCCADHVDRLKYTLRVGKVNHAVSSGSGYLFVCPLADLRRDTRTRFGHPDCSVFWSLDPNGVERLRIKETNRLGFPSLSFQMEALLSSWADNVYAGLCQFYREKENFDPHSHDAASHLGYPLYELCSDLEPPVDCKEKYRRKDIPAVAIYVEPAPKVNNRHDWKSPTTAGLGTLLGLVAFAVYMYVTVSALEQ
ncbi:hypothetical protein C8R43DRAFT_173118 [Mycena crocata]|nr:hypothetical protein C8R43DRAFT_173118 [Mycena crocata]